MNLGFLVWDNPPQAPFYTFVALLFWKTGPWLTGLYDLSRVSGIISQYLG
jgi:hypothetical protein